MESIALEWVESIRIRESLREIDSMRESLREVGGNNRQGLREVNSMRESMREVSESLARGEPGKVGNRRGRAYERGCLRVQV